jgi:hypothetical protein
MSITEFTRNDTSGTVPYAQLSFLSLNDLFNERMRKAQAQFEHAGLVVRCECLPQINGYREEMTRLFDSIISMILNHPSKPAQLFLYVDCEEIKDAGKQETGLINYLIKIHTNLTTNDNWKAQNREMLAACERILILHKGSFAVHNISNTGCLFSISLPGKSQ